MLSRALAGTVLVFGLATIASAEHRVLVIGDKTLSIVAPDGKTEWEMPWPGIHDIHVLPNGHILTTRDFRKVVEIDLALALDAASNGSPLADSLIYATARLHGAVLWTQDGHFESLPGVNYFAKPAVPSRH